MSNDRSFQPRHRLLTPADYASVFKGNTSKASNRYALVLVKAHGRDNSRLGLVVAKKHVRRAVDRNRIKRVVREYFRTHRPPTHSDLVFLARQGIGGLTREELRNQLDHLWRKLPQSAHDHD